MSKYVEASNVLIERINNALASGEYPENISIWSSDDKDIFDDVKILCHEFGNPAIIEMIGSTPTLARCRKVLEKIRDTALFRTRTDN